MTNTVVDAPDHQIVIDRITGEIWEIKSGKKKLLTRCNPRYIALNFCDKPTQNDAVENNR